LVITLIIFGIIVVTSLSVALTTVRQIRTSMQASKTNIAYQNADEGIDRVMEVILKGGPKAVDSSNGNIFISTVTGSICSDGVIKNGTKYTVQLLGSCTDNSNNSHDYPIRCDESSSTITVIPTEGTCSNPTVANDISAIAQLKSTGNDNATGTQRILGANVQQKNPKIKLLLHFDTDPSASPLQIVDSSRVHHAISNNNNKVTIDISDKPSINPNYGVGVFPGSDSYIRTSDATDDWKFGNGDYTFDFWANINSTGGNTQSILTILNGSNNVSRIFYDRINSKLGVALGDPELSYNCQNAIDAGWHHIALIRDSNKIKFYVDGMSDSSSKCYLNSGTDVIDNTTANLTEIKIGADKPPLQFFNGKIDELRIYAGKFWTEDFPAGLPSKPY
jgi:hypothetical protein